MRCSFNVKGNQKICAFCKYWYDPGDKAITPINPQMGAWEYDREAKRVCLKHNSPNQHAAYAFACSDYECRIPK